MERKKGNVIKDTRFKQPQWNATLWRYMSFEKFFDILLNRSLYFTNLDLMTDKNEAVIPEKNKIELKRKFQDKDTNKEETEKQYIQFWVDILRQKKSCFVNSWIVDPDESYALWKIYLGGGKLGIAVKTNTKRLIDSINSEPQKLNDKIFLGKVTYENYITGDINFETLITHKRKPYSYEKEARLIVFREPEFEQGFESKKQIVKNGIKFNVNPEILINEIYLSPFGGKLFSTTVVQLIKKLMPNLVPLIKNSEIKDI